MPRRTPPGLPNAPSEGRFLGTRDACALAAALTCSLVKIIPLLQEASPTKLTSIKAAAVGAGGETTHPWIPRPLTWGVAVQWSAPRTAVGVNELFYLLSECHPDAVSYTHLTLPTILRV